LKGYFSQVISSEHLYRLIFSVFDIFELKLGATFATHDSIFFGLIAGVHQLCKQFVVLAHCWLADATFSTIYCFDIKTTEEIIKGSVLKHLININFLKGNC
jgi:hypothetical protein